MTPAETETQTRPAPLVISRTFAAPRALVFKAWSSAEHIKRWFSPEGFTTPEAEIDFRPGGVFAICMRSPEGENYWCRGQFVAISPPDRLVVSMVAWVGDESGFTAHTTVTFEEDGAGTRMTVHQQYEMHDMNFLSSVRGAPEGWRTTLDKLAREIARMQEVAERGSVVHDTFHIERSYDAPVAAVYRALSDPAAKARWFKGGDGYVELERAMDVRPGGRERLKGRWPSGTVSTFDAIYLDVVPEKRIVYAYDMFIDNRKISVSLATLELAETGSGTRLVVTEQGAFLDGYEDNGSRKHGTGHLLDRLGASL